MYNGRLVKHVSQTGPTTTYAYDNFGRRTTVTDGRGNVTTTAFDSVGRVSTVTDDASNVTTYVYYSTSGTNAGRLHYTQNDLSNKVHHEYDLHGRVYRTWGHAVWPVEYGYAIAGGTATEYTLNNLNQHTATASPSESFSYDDDGNLTADGSYTYAWDGENRLVEVAKASPASGDKKVVNLYDYRGRRVQKTVYTHNGSTWGSPIATYRYQHCDALIVVERDGSNNALRKYTWGLDILGQQGAAARFDCGGALGSVGVPPAALDSQLGGAGGIGGLLAMEDLDSGTTQTGGHLYFADGNGNIGQVVDCETTGAGTLEAKYEYDPYGARVNSKVSGEIVNPFCFSTKVLDDEIDYPGTTADGLYCYDIRFVMPRTGRWTSRDPIGEQGAGVSLYAALRNAPMDWIDPDGLDALPAGWRPPWLPSSGGPLPKGFSVDDRGQLYPPGSTPGRGPRSAIAALPPVPTSGGSYYPGH